MEFRKDINGLRALAVLSVVVFHFDSTWMPGGFAGVDIFFVISGYLMTGIIFTGLKSDKFNLFSFYKSRAKRIIPALAALCLAVFAFGWFFLGNSEFLNLARHSLGSLLFFSNFLYWGEAGYFDAVSTSKWLLHTWSLSVEWQFYMLYPLLVMALVRFFSGEVARILILALSVICMLLSVYFTFRWPDASYYLLPARSWEMLLGAVVFLFPWSVTRKQSFLLFFLGVILVCISFISFSSEDFWPGYLAAIPVAGTALVLYANRKNSIVLTNPFSQKIGLWSYSIYLWHWPIVVFLYFHGPSISLSLKLVGIFASIVLGALSYYLVERGRGYVMKMSFASFALAFCVVTISQNDNVNELREYTAQYEKKDWVEFYKKSYVPGGEYWFACNAARHLVKTGELRVEGKCIENKGAGGVVLWGDSHAGALSGVIPSILKDGVAYNQLASTACAASWSESLYRERQNRGKPRDLGCSFQNDLMRELVAKVKPNTVIIVQARDHESRGLVATALELKRLGVENVILVGPVPQWLPSLPQVLSKPHKTVNELLLSDSLDPKAVKSNSELKKQLAAHPDIKFVDIIGNYCLENEVGLACKYMADDEHLMAFDYGHPTPEGAALIVEELLKPKIDAALVRY